MTWTSQKDNIKKVVSILENFFTKPFDIHFSWDAPISSEYILNQNNETSHYEEAIIKDIDNKFYNQSEKDVLNTAQLANEKNILIVIQFMKDDDGMLLYEGDVVQLNDNELLIEQKSLALLSILDKKNLVSLVKHV